MLTSYQQSAKTKLIASLVAIVVIAGVVVLADHLKSSTSRAMPVAANTSADSSLPSAGSSATGSSSNSTGSTGSSTASGKAYTASSSYSVPHGQENIKVTLTVDNGTVNDVSVQNSEYDRTSARYQEDFTASLKDYVVGKKVKDLQIGAIAGASDTAQAFNDAVSQIASQVN